MSRRFITCMANGGRESARLSYGCSKLTLIPIERKKLRDPVKNYFADFFHFGASSEASEFCWQIGLNFLEQ